MKTLLAMLLVVGVGASADAQGLYRYVDEKGEVHMTDDPNKIPKAKGGKGDAVDPRHTPSLLKDETVWLPLPTGYKIGFEDRQVHRSLTGWIPQAENVKDLTEAVTLTVHWGSKSMTLEQFQTSAQDAWRAECKDVFQQAVHSGNENGYPVSVFALVCSLNRATNKPEYIVVKAMQGNDNLYVVQRVFRFGPTKEQAVEASEFVKRVTLCDSRLPGRACPTENLVVPLATNFKIDYQARQGNQQLVEAVPRGESVKNWTEIVSYRVYSGMKNTPLDKYRTGMKVALEATCKSSHHQAVQSGKERGYPVSVFLHFCHLNPATGKPEYTFFKIIQGNDSFYTVHKAFKFEPTKEQALEATEFLKGVVLCDVRLPDRACPPSPAIIPRR